MIVWPSFDPRTLRHWAYDAIRGRPGRVAGACRRRRSSPSCSHSVSAPRTASSAGTEGSPFSKVTSSAASGQDSRPALCYVGRALAHQTRGARCLPTHSRPRDEGQSGVPACGSCDATPMRQPPPDGHATATNSLNRACPRGGRPCPDDLFHEPEVHPKTATANASHKVTLRGHRPIRGGSILIQAR